LEKKRRVVTCDSLGTARERERDGGREELSFVAKSTSAAVVGQFKALKEGS
jgi:hypothetical protein